MTGGGAQLERPVRPGQHLIFVQRRLRHDLEIRHRARALAEGGADAVRSGIAAADHHHMFTGRQDRRAHDRRFTADSPVLLRQIIHREMNALELASGHRQVAGMFRAAREHHRIVLG